MVGDNIKKIREELGLTQQKFAERIGITQSAIAGAESGKRALSRQALLAISREFGVRLEWLETGEGEKYAQRDTTILAKLSAAYNLSPKSRALIENYLKLPPDVRDLVALAVEQAAKLYPRATEARLVPRKSDAEKSVEEMREETNRELDAVAEARKRATTPSSVSTITSGSYSKKFGSSS